MSPPGPRPALLVVAKAPVPGLAKARLAAEVGAAVAADLAAAALLDTLEAARGAGHRSVVALTGDLRQAARRRELERALSGHLVIGQRGDGLGQRLANAHTDAARVAGVPAVVQVGMDTPQLTTRLLGAAVDSLADADAALAPATDGGWWCLAVRRAEVAGCLADVAMSRADTGVRTYDALLLAGARTVSSLPELRDVDTLADALEVAGEAPDSRFTAAVDAHALAALAATR